MHACMQFLLHVSMYAIDTACKQVSMYAIDAA
jgi:hypothetical protein